MDAVMIRIIEIEKECAMDIERAEESSRKNIEAHQRALEEKKEQTHANIISTENHRLTEALRVLNQQTGEASLAAGKDYESRFQSPATLDAVKEKIVAILLAG